MILLFFSHVDSARRWRKALAEVIPELEFRFWPDEIGNPLQIDYVLGWKIPKGELQRYPNLKAIFSLGAGVDHIVGDSDLPRHLPVSRLVDRCLTQGMSEYIIYWVIHHHRFFEQYREIVKNREWRQIAQADSRICRIGLLGLGELGRDAAEKLAVLEYDVAGWSQSPKDIPNVQSFFGSNQLQRFLQRTDILICLLPLTEDTFGIINKNNLAQLPTGAVLVNCARGAHVVDEDLIEALDTGQIDSAVLDVFQAEPLPQDHPFWSHPKIIITPHMASLTVAHSAAHYVAENIRRVERGEPPLNLVDFSRGY